MLHDVTGVAYRVEVTHQPRNGSAVCWEAKVYRPADNTHAEYSTFRGSREQAFDDAQDWVKKSQLTRELPSTVYLDAAGEIIDSTELGL